MTTGRAIAWTVQITALAIWCGVMLTTGAAAAVLFPTMKELDPSVPRYAGFEGEHWPLVAGHAAAKLFLISDIVQFVCALLATGTFLWLALTGGGSGGRVMTLVRGTVLSVALACVAGLLIVVGPPMNTALVAYRKAAEAGLTDEALSHRAEFADLHPIASNLIAGSTLCAGLVLVLGVWTLARARHAGGSVAPSSAKPKPEEPELVKRGGVR